MTCSEHGRSPELDRVVFDTNAEDIVISGKARKDNGKGYRAITYAAFVIATLHGDDSGLGPSTKRKAPAAGLTREASAA
jgi:hypothetical protein